MKKDNISTRSLFFLLITLLFCYLVAQGAQAEEGKWVAIAAGGYNGKVIMFEIPAMKLLKETRVGVDIHGVAISPDAKFVYATDKAANKVIRINLETFEIEPPISELPPGFGPSNLAIHNDSLFVTGELGGEIAKIDLKKGEVERVLKASDDISAPDAIAVTSDGKYCLATDYFNNLLKVYTTTPFDLKRKITVGEAPHGLIIASKYALVGNKLSSTISFIDLSGGVETWKVEDEIETAGAPFDIGADSQGSFAYQCEFLGNVISKISIEKREVVAQFKVRARPYALALTPDNRYLISANAYSPGVSTRLRLPRSSKRVVPMNLELLDLNDGESIAREPVTGCPRAIRIADVQLSAELLKRFGGKRCPFIEGQEVDLPPKEKVTLVYVPAISRPPGVKRKGVNLKVFSYGFVPSELSHRRYLRRGTDVKLSLTNLDKRAGFTEEENVTHGFIINGYGKQTNVLLPTGVTATLKFKADKKGDFTFYCNRICGPMCKEMRGRFRVR